MNNEPITGKMILVKSQEMGFLQVGKAMTAARTIWYDSKVKQCLFSFPTHEKEAEFKKHDAQVRIILKELTNEDLEIVTLVSTAPVTKPPLLKAPKK